MEMTNGYYWTRLKLPGAHWRPVEWKDGSWLGAGLSDYGEHEIDVGPRIPGPFASSVKLYTKSSQMLSDLPFDWLTEVNEPEPPPDGSYIRVLMSGRDMVDETGVAEVCSVQYRDGHYRVLGTEKQIEGFATQNEAIAALAEHLREKNRGKFGCTEYLMQRGPEEPLADGIFTSLMCPTCKVPVTKHGMDFRKPNFECPKCSRRFVSIGTGERGARKYGLELIGHQWFLRARAGGFTEDQAELIRKMFEALEK